MIRPRPASFGGVEFDVVAWRDDVRRVLDQNRPVNKTGAALRNRGTEARTTNCEIVFFDRDPIDGEDANSSLDFYSRFQLFTRVALNGRTQKFVHPMAGAYPAKVEDLEVSQEAEALDLITVGCTFVEDSTEPSPFVTDTRRPIASGIQDARVEAGTVQTEFESRGLDTGFLDRVNSTLDEWRLTATGAGGDVAVQLGTLTRTIENVQTTSDLLSDPSSYPAWVATERLIYRLRVAAESVRSTGPRVKSVVVQVSQPLRQFVAKVLGAADAQATYDEVLSLNQIEDPGFLQAGSTIRVPVTADPETGFTRGAAR